MPQTNPYITPQQVRSIAYQDGLLDEQLKLYDMAILTLSEAVMDRLDEQCALQETQWISQRHHPYSASQLVKRDQYQKLPITAIVPPMGASPLAGVVEDLVACGIQAVFLVCAALSLGVKKLPDTQWLLSRIKGSQLGLQESLPGRQLLSKKRVDDAADILAEVGSGRRHLPVDAQLHLTVKEEVVIAFPVSHNSLARV